jgi:hypothetical protein
MSRPLFLGLATASIGGPLALASLHIPGRSQQLPRFRRLHERLQPTDLAAAMIAATAIEQGYVRKREAVFWVVICVTPHVFRGLGPGIAG